jgi:hypothetical protein
MSLWDQHDMSARVQAVLDDVHLNNPDGHHFGRPFVSSYQIAIALDAADPNLKHELNKPVGGTNAGSHNSMAQYIGNELSKQIKAAEDSETAHFADGAFMSNESVKSLVYDGADGSDVVSSLPGTEFDMALFRLRQ